MKCTPEEIAELAREWVDTDRAVLRRACLNRAYYAAYHSAHGLAELVPGDDSHRGPKGGLGHREVARRLRHWRNLPMPFARLRRFASVARSAGDQLYAAIACRESADYDLLDDTLSAEEAKLQMLRMQGVLSFVKVVTPELERLSDDQAG